MSFKVKEKTDCILRYAEEKSPTNVLWMFHEKYGRNSNASNNKTIIILNGLISSRQEVPSANQNPSESSSQYARDC